MTEQGIMYRFRQNENPGKIGLANMQKLASGEADGVLSDLLATGYDVKREVPLAEEGSVTLYEASDNRCRGRKDRFFAVWVRVDSSVPLELRSLSRVFEITGHAINNGARSVLLSAE